METVSGDGRCLAMAQVFITALELAGLADPMARDCLAHQPAAQMLLS